VILYCADLADAQQRVVAAGGEVVQAVFAFPGAAASTSAIWMATNWRSGVMWTEVFVPSPVDGTRTAPSPVRRFRYDRPHIATRDASASSQQEPP
jgi:hypothetical protein